MDPVALQQMLAEARAVVEPKDFGLERPNGRRGRRINGLSQYQMDVLLKRAPGTYGKFERGDRDFTPSHDFLHDVGRILGLEERQFSALWLYWYGQQPPHALSPVAGLTVPQLYHDLVPKMGVAAYISRKDWDVLVHNEAAAACFPHGRMIRNSMRWMVLDQEARERYLPWWKEIWAQRALSQLQAAVTKNRQNEALQELDAEVRRDPYAAPVYASLLDPFIHPDGDVRPFIHGTLGYGVLRLGAAQPFSSEDARLILMDFHSCPPVVVHRPSCRGRRVEVCCLDVGYASDPRELVDLVRRGGAAALRQWAHPERWATPDIDDPELIEWREGDRTVWR